MPLVVDAWDAWVEQRRLDALVAEKVGIGRSVLVEDHDYAIQVPIFIN